jgi:hypothetical protein
MKEYPSEILPLYAQGYSLARYLIDQGGRQKFLNFIGEGLKRENWSVATKNYYGYRNLAHLQDSWLEWVKQGSPSLEKPSGQANQLAVADNRPAHKSKIDSVPIAQARFQSEDGATSSPSRRDNPARSTFETSADLIARNDRRRAGDAPIELAQGGGGSRAVRSNKRSVYDRGIEPSGNAYQYPFKASPQSGEAQSVAAAAAPATVADAHREEPPRTAPSAAANSSPGRRQVILEWRRDDNR